MNRLMVAVVSAILLDSISTVVNAQSSTVPSSSGNPSGSVEYPYGSVVYPDGRISTPAGNVFNPSATVPNGDGSTTYYYRNGSRIRVGNNTISPSGTYIRPGSLNQGVQIRPLPPDPVRPAGSNNR